MNTTIVLANVTEEMALPLQGKKSNFNEGVFFQYFGIDRLGLNEKVLTNIKEEMVTAFPEWNRFIEISFLSDEKKEAYLEVLNQRKRNIGWT